MSLHTWHHQGPRIPSSYATFMLNPHRGRVATGKKSLVSMLQLSPTLHDPVDCFLTGFSCQECSPGKNIGVYWPILVAILF